MHARARPAGRVVKSARARTYRLGLRLLILPIILFCISHYTSPIILSFLPIILKLFSTENSVIIISGTPVHACAYYTNLRIFIAKLPLQIFTARVGLRFAVTVVDARLSPLDGELGDLQAASSSTVPREFLRILSDYSRIIPILSRAYYSIFYAGIIAAGLVQAS